MILKNCLMMMREHPKTVLPLIMTYAYLLGSAAYIFWQYHMNYDWLYGNIFLVMFLYYLGFSFSVILSASLLLEFLQHLESGVPLSLRASIKDILSHNLLHLLPISVSWALLLFVLFIVEVVLRSLLSRSNGEETVASRAVGIAFTLARKKARMAVFLMLPAIAWENRNAWDAVWRGFDIVDGEIGEFFQKFVKTGFLSLLFYGPIFVVSLLVGFLEIELPFEVWIGFITYSLAVFALSMHIEQIACAEIFLWVMNREAAFRHAHKNRLPFPKREDIRKPTFFDGVPEMDRLLAREIEAEVTKEPMA